jgi:hypothetical protein
MFGGPAINFITLSEMTETSIDLLKVDNAVKRYTDTFYRKICDPHHRVAASVAPAGRIFGGRTKAVHASTSSARTASWNR